MVLYVVFFSTGFMGGAALFLLDLRVRSRILKPILLFQFFFLAGTGLILLYLERIQDGAAHPALEAGLLALIMAVNVGVWVTVLVICRRVSPESRTRYSVSHVAQVLILLVILKGLANIVVIGTVPAAAIPEAWHIGTQVLAALAMAAFGLVMRGPVTPSEPRVLHPLFKSYGTISIVFAIAGVAEYFVRGMEYWWAEYITLEYLLYFSWNVVSMSAAVQLFRPRGEFESLLPNIPGERVRALGLSPREVEIAGMIGQGLSNKEIAAALHISPATVRTHIYNLYQKVGAGSRVELLRMLQA